MTVPAPEQGKSIEDIFRRQVEEAERRAVEERERRLAAARASVEENPHDPDTYIDAARCCKQLDRLEETLSILQSGIARCASHLGLHEYYIERLEKCNRTEEAIAAAQDAMRLFPEDLYLKIWEATLLPVLYDTTSQLERYRERFEERLRRFCEELRLETAEERLRALAAIGKHVIKYLAYQGRNDRELQLLYGGLVHRIMAANYPDWVQPLQMPRKQDGERIRVGYVSARFRNVSATKVFGGWLREHSRERLELFAYNVGRHADTVPEQVQRLDLCFRQFSGPLEEIAQAIQTDRLDVLVYLDIGMQPMMAQLAALRLAPVQCAAWDHPVTTGLPTMDCFLSSELMEPRDAQDHYSERLVCLPGVGTCYSKPVISAALLAKTRRDFRLRDEAVVYLSCQSIFKYLPEQDTMFAEIAKRVPNSQFVFLTTNRVVAGDFQRRLDRDFAAAGLRGADACVLLPELSLRDYWNLDLLSDVFLDTVGWSGGVSTLEAIASGLPVVTMPGKLMRGRQSSGILSQLGVTETIARDEEDYIDIAVRLGLDRQWRQDVVNKMASGYPKLYSDTRCVRALEGFYRDAVEERLSS